MEILFIVGSLRHGSFNRRVADCAMKDLEGKATIRFLDWREVPLLDADYTYPFNEQETMLRQAITDADALWIFCPEYNGAVPGGLKNVLDIASLSYEKGNFASGSPLRGKCVAVSGAGGKAATKFAREQLTTLLTRCGCKVLKEQCGFALPGSAFSDNIWEPDEKEQAEIRKEADDFLKFIAENK